MEKAWDRNPQKGKGTVQKNSHEKDKKSEVSEKRAM